MSLNTELLNKVKRARIFFFDIDGTIVKFKANTMSEPLRADLKELQRLGYKVYVASGRSPAMMENVSNFAFDGYMGSTANIAFVETIDLIMLRSFVVRRSTETISMH